MSYAAHARTSYGHSNAQAIKTPRDIEYDVMARITGRIQANLPKAGGRIDAALTEALNENRRLWSSFAVDLAQPENGLPSELRARLFYLAEFTMKHTSQVLQGKAAPGVLVDINTAVMRGLRGQGGR